MGYDEGKVREYLDISLNLGIISEIAYNNIRQMESGEINKFLAKRILEDKIDGFREIRASYERIPEELRTSAFEVPVARLDTLIKLLSE